MRTFKYQISYLKRDSLYEALSEDEKERYECNINGSIKSYEIYSDELDDWIEVPLEKYFRLYPDRMKKIEEQILLCITQYINDEILNVADLQIKIVKENF